MEYIWHADSPLGELLLASDGATLCGLWFEGQKHYAETLSPAHEEMLLPVFEQTVTWLELYFSGKVPGFTPPLQMKGTPFQRSVWERLLQIPFGETVSYGEIAQSIAQDRKLPGMSARAVVPVCFRGGRRKNPDNLKFSVDKRKLRW